MAAWLLLIFFICLHNQLSSLYFSITYQSVQMFEKCDSSNHYQINSKDDWSLLSARFTAKFVLVFVLSLGNAFSQGFHFKANRKSMGSFKNGTRDFRNRPPFERSACFYVTINRNFERFQYFNFGTDFLENKNLSQKTVVPFFS